jgi:hypothetical protein
MAYDLELGESEQVIANLTFCPSASSEPLSIAVSNQAIYLPRNKVIAKVDPTFFERVPSHEVMEVRIRKLRPVWLLVWLSLRSP